VNDSHPTMADSGQPGDKAKYEAFLQLAERTEDSGRSSRAANFYRLAGEAAAAEFHNEIALDCFTRALGYTLESALVERFGLLLARERLLALKGATLEQSHDLAALETIANLLNEDMYRAQVAARQAAWREATGDLAGAVTVASMAARLAELADLPQAEALARSAWGRALTRQSHYRQAQEQLDRALLMAHKHGDKALEAAVERHRGVLAYDRAQMDKAGMAYRRALSLYRDIGDRRGQIHVHSNLGQIHQVRGQLTDARRHWVESLELFRQLGDAEGSLRTLVNLAASSCDYGQYDEARVYAQQALHEAKKSNIPIGSCFAHLNLGLATHYQGENQLSVSENRAAYQIAIDLGSQRLQAHALSVQGHALVELEQFSAAEEAYWEAVAIWQRLEIPNMVAEAKAGLARLALRQQNEALAKELVGEVWAQIAIDPNLDGAELPVRIYLTCYQVFKKTGNSRAAEALAAGRDLLEKQSAGLDDDDVRSSLRQQIPAHRDILAI
jgi:tetratricopeptide (TPR) repeat protein